MLKVFSILQYCRSLIQPAEDAVKYLLARGWTLSKVKPTDTQSVPLKPKMTCLRRRRRRAGSFVGREAKEAANYEPSVIDLSKVETPVELLVREWRGVEGERGKGKLILKLTRIVLLIRLLQSRWLRMLMTNGPGNWILTMVSCNPTPSMLIHVV